MQQDLIRPIADTEYLRDESKKVGFAESISFPETEEEVRQIMTQMHGSNTCVTV